MRSGSKEAKKDTKFKIFRVSLSYAFKTKSNLNRFTRSNLSDSSVAHKITHVNDHYRIIRSPGASGYFLTDLFEGFRLIDPGRVLTAREFWKNLR